MDREPSEAEDFYTVDKAARILKLTPGRIRQMLRAGELEGVTSTRYFFDPSTAPRRTAGDNLARLRAFRYAVRMPDASRPVGDLRNDQIRKRLRVPVQEVAHLLGISPEAVRSRLYRGTLDKEIGTDGTVYVRLHDDQVRPNDEQTVDTSQPNTELVEELRARVEDLRGQHAEEREARRRADTIIAQLARTTEEQAHTIRALEPAPEHSAPSDERKSSETSRRSRKVLEEPRPATVEAQEGVQRPWWRRIFGG